MTDERTLTAMYSSRGAAETARDALLDLGISDSAIAVHGTSSGTTHDEGKGFWASLADLFVPDDDRDVYAEGIRRGGYLLSVNVPADLHDRAAEVLESSVPVDMDAQVESWLQTGWSGHAAREVRTEGVDAGLASADLETPIAEGYAAPAAPRTGIGTGSGEEDVIQAAEEQLRVGKREVGRGSVRVRSYVTERPVEEQVTLRDERVRVERRPVDRPVAPGEATFQEKEIEVTARGEEAVISKEARVTEEISLTKDVDTRTETVRDTVRKQEIEVEDDRTDIDVGRTDPVDPGYRTDR